MVRARPDRPCALGDQPLQVLDDRPHGIGLERGVDEDEVEAAVQLVVPVAVELHQGGQLLDVRLADEQALRVVVPGDGAPTPQDVVRLGPVGVVDRFHPHELLVEGVVGRRGRVVAQLGVLDHHVAHVDAEARHAAVPPEPHDVVELAAHVLAPPVQVRLRRLEIVQEVLTARLVHLPSRPAEDAHPVVGRPASRRGVGPHVVVAVCGVTPAQRVDEPRVLVARVVGDQVHEDPDPAPARLGHQSVQVGQRPVVGIDVAVVRHVVAPVAVGRARDRREPDAGDTQPSQVVQPPDDPRQVPHAVAVGVGERAGVDLVEDSALPPTVRSVPAPAPGPAPASVPAPALDRARRHTPPTAVKPPSTVTAVPVT